MALDIAGLRSIMDRRIQNKLGMSLQTCSLTKPDLFSCYRTIIIYLYNRNPSKIFLAEKSHSPTLLKEDNLIGFEVAKLSRVERINKSRLLEKD